MKRQEMLDNFYRDITIRYHYDLHYNPEKYGVGVEDAPLWTVSYPIDVITFLPDGNQNEYESTTCFSGNELKPLLKEAWRNYKWENRDC